MNDEKIAELQRQLTFYRTALEAEKIESNKTQDQISDALRDELRAHRRTQKSWMVFAIVYSTTVIFDYTLRGIQWWLS